MEKIDDILYTTIKDDSTIRGYTGYTATDPRIYPAHTLADIDITSAKPAYITYFKVADVPPFADLEEEIYQFDVWSKSQQTNLNIFARIDTLLNDRVLTPASGTNTKIHRETHKAILDPDRKYHHYIIQYRIFYYG